MRNLLLMGLCIAGYVVEGVEPGRAVLVGTNVVSLGVYPGTEERKVRVEIRNDGQGELKIDGVALSCDCFRVDGYTQYVAVGKVGEVVVAIRKNELVGVFRKAFYVRTDDPVRRLIMITVEGTATPPGFQIVPDQVILKSSESVARPCFLIVLDSLQTPDMEKLECRSSLDGIVFHPVLSKGGNGFLIEVAFSANAIEQCRKGVKGVLFFRYCGGSELSIPILSE